MNYEKIGEFIAKKRKEKNLTQKDLAQLIGVTDKAVSKWERGLGCPDVSILEVLSKELDVSILEILKGRIIENEVIKVTELNDYVLDTVKYTNNSTKDKIKNLISNIITIIIIGICSFLLIMNVNHMIYLYKDIPNTLTDKNLEEMNKNIELISNNINIIKSNQGIFNDEDYNNMLNNINDMYNNLTKMKILNYNTNTNNTKISRNDYFLLDVSNEPLKIINTYKTLTKYNQRINDYLELYISSYISRVFSNTDSLDKTYKYRLVDYENELYSVDLNMMYKINYTLYIEKEILYLTNNIIEVGDINE